MDSSVSHSGDDSSVDVWYTNKSLLSHTLIQKQRMVAGQGLPLCLHCVLSVIQSRHLHFTRSESLSWPTTGGHCLSLCVCALTYFHFESAHVPASVLLCWVVRSHCVRACVSVLALSEVY